MNNTAKLTIIMFELPDGRLVLQRRTKDAPYAPGLLTLFGGWVEANETPLECIKREITEETNLDVNNMDIQTITDFIVPASQDFDKDRHFYLYKASIPNLDFEVYEGDGAEAFSIDELKNRPDLTGSAKYTLNNILK
jgi:8-oxo-dGTP pyrophosphatase MutT (NUDIX family)